MANDEPHDHPDMTKHDYTLYIFTGLPGVKISFTKDRDSGKKAVEFGPVHDVQSAIPCFNFQANCFKHMIETNLKDMDFIPTD
jgi:hypothetical protein